MTIAFDIRCHRLLVAGLLAGLCTAGLATASTPFAPTQDESPAKADLPKAKDVFDSALKAMGGREALANIKSSMVKSKMTTPMGELALESYFLSPDRFLLKQTIPGMGEVTMGSNGETTWALNPMMGYQLMEPEEAEDLRGQASMHNIIHRLEKEFKDITTVDRQKFHDQDCYKLRMIDKEGEEQFAFFNAENHLMAGLEMKQNSPMGPTTATMRFEEWKTYGDIKMFTRMVVSQMGMNMTMEMTEIEFDKVDKAVFTLPAEVKKLADERRAAEEANEKEDKDESSEESSS